MSLEEKITQLNQNISVLVKVLEENTGAMLAQDSASPGGAHTTRVEGLVVNTQFGEPDGPVTETAQQTEVPPKKKSKRRTKAQIEAEAKQAAALAAQEAEIVAQAEAANVSSAQAAEAVDAGQTGSDVVEEQDPWNSLPGVDPEPVRLTVTGAEDPAETLKNTLNVIAQKLGNEMSKLGDLLKTLGVTQLSALPADKRDDMLNQANELLPEDQRLTSL